MSSCLSICYSYIWRQNYETQASDAETNYNRITKKIITNLIKCIEIKWWKYRSYPRPKSEAVSKWTATSLNPLCTVLWHKQTVYTRIHMFWKYIFFNSFRNISTFMPDLNLFFFCFFLPATNNVLTNWSILFHAKIYKKKESICLQDTQYRFWHLSVTFMHITWGGYGLFENSHGSFVRLSCSSFNMSILIFR